MAIIVKFIGLVISVLGLAIFASPQFSQKVFAFFQEGKRLYYSGVARVLVAAALFAAASQSPAPLAAIALGIMGLVSAIVIFAADMEKLKSFTASYSQMPALIIRLLGLVAASFGMLIVALF